MSKVICASAECKYNADDHSCTCKKIYMNDMSIMTVWDGRQHLWRCKSFEKRESSLAERRLEQIFIKSLERDGIDVI